MKKELLDRFIALHDMAIESKDESKMEVLSETMITAISAMIELNYNRAMQIIDALEGCLSYNNFVTGQEADEITRKMVNWDDSTGPKYRDMPDFFRKLSEYGVSEDNKPYYNKYALYVTANMFASDQGSVLMEMAENNSDKAMHYSVKMAVNQLTDKDRPNWIREYFYVD